MKSYLKFLKEYENLLARKSGLTITVSGLSGSGKTTVAKEIAKVFNLKLANAGDLFREYAAKNKIPLDEMSKSLPPEIDYQIDKMMLNLAERGGYVLVARLSAWVAGDWADCKIFIQCDKKIRYKRVAKREGLSLSRAKIRVENRDNRDYQRYKTLYNVDTNDKTIYDLIINNNQISLEELKGETIKKIKIFFKK
ncbi:cytidylate kinase family protein [bacterium]|nr:cytidylate kinase family protein [bacterium]